MRIMWKGMILVMTAMLACYPFSDATAEKGVSDKQIVIGGSLDLTGPAAFMGQGVYRGIKLYFAKVNGEGGINGRKLTYVAEDDGYVVAKTISNYKKLTMRDNVLCLLGSTGSVGPKALIPYLEEDKVPLIGPYGYTSAMFRPAHRYLFNIYSSCEEHGKILIDFLKTNLKLEQPRVGILAEDNEIGEDTIRGTKAQMSKYGWGEPSVELYKRSAIDFSSPVLKLKRGDVDVLFFPVIASHGVSILKECEKAGFQPYLFGAATMTDKKFLENAGEAAFYGKGLRCFATQVDQTGVSPGAQEFQIALANYDPDNKDPNSFNLFGYGIAKIVCEALKQCGKDVTREKLVQALETLKNYDSDIFPLITYATDVRQGTDSACIMKANKASNGFVAETGWIKPKD